MGIYKGEPISWSTTQRFNFPPTKEPLSQREKNKGNFLRNEESEKKSEVKKISQFLRDRPLFFCAMVATAGCGLATLVYVARRQAFKAFNR